MKEQMRKNSKPQPSNRLEPGDSVKYVIDTKRGAVERIGKILLMDGTWCVVRLRSQKLVWVSLRDA